MTAEKLLPLIVAGIYLTTGILHARKGEYPAFTMWLCYAIANVACVFALGANK
jgi:hypothetical protein